MAFLNSIEYLVNLLKCDQEGSFMNKYKVAETIVTKIIADLRRRMESGVKWDVADEKTH